MRSLTHAQLLHAANHTIPIFIHTLAGIDPPRYAKPGDAGADLCARLDEAIILQPGKRVTIPTGVFLALPQGFEAQVRPRSGLADRYGFTVLNAPGTIDSSYRGEIGVILFNAGERHQQIAHGDRIAQLVITPVYRAEWVPVERPEDLGATERGTGGFGSTGIEVTRSGQAVLDAFANLPQCLKDDSVVGPMELSELVKRDPLEAVTLQPPIPEEIKCGACAGCGQIANDDEGTPWQYWADLAPPSNLAVVIGIVRPLPCPSCGGSGKRGA